MTGTHSMGETLLLMLPTVCCRTPPRLRVRWAVFQSPPAFFCLRAESSQSSDGASYAAARRFLPGLFIGENSCIIDCQFWFLRILSLHLRACGRNKAHLLWKKPRIPGSPDSRPMIF